MRLFYQSHFFLEENGKIYHIIIRKSMKGDVISENINESSKG